MLHFLEGSLERKDCVRIRPVALIFKTTGRSLPHTPKNGLYCGLVSHGKNHKNIKVNYNYTVPVVHSVQADGVWLTCPL